ncbi:PREDICTED: AAA-ATPase At3g28510-like [Tarenaya hassleriana]|uniref:AAA-ATPase At3g28510-like n=1 Tax=Tarenaya hassleriana TaxID=28532 RepID=UPI0008FCF7C2|nr:PREDICTED: AAA-ATPase At3g28510-like [Tarenaya hassleriana]
MKSTTKPISENFPRIQETIKSLPFLHKTDLKSLFLDSKKQTKEFLGTQETSAEAESDRRKDMLQVLWSFSVMGVTNFMFLWAIYRQYFPYNLRVHMEKYAYKMMGWVSPNVHVTFHEYTGEHLKRSGAYVAIRNYLSLNSTTRAKRLKANESKDSKSVVLSLDDHEEIEEEFGGVKVKWISNVRTRDNESRWGRSSDERRFFTLTFHRNHRKMITESYIEHVLREGKAIEVRNRERKLFTNNSSQDWFSWRERKWSNVPFEHPATFDTLAMDPAKKEEIKKDLIKFSRGKEYYKKVGKPWKRGYLLHGPPGTGKSTMISAMANFLDYDVYDLELTTVKDNSELKRLLLDTTSKSIIVIEDIDCSLELTGQRKKKEDDDDDEEDEEEKKEAERKEKREREAKQNRVTLSGLLNAIDGLWSACTGEKIIVFTTNFVDKLDPALIRRGRMDNHIQMSYCRYEAFRVLAKNYLEIETHVLYEEIKRLLEETDMSPADVAENLMPKSDEEDENTCLKRLVLALEEAKEKAREMAEEEEKKKARKEERKKEKKKKAEEEEKKKKTGEEETVKKKNKAEENGDASDQENGN